MLTVTHSGTLVFASADSYAFWEATSSHLQTVAHFVGVGDLDHGLWLVARASILEKDYFWGVYVTDPFVATFARPNLTAGALECVTVVYTYTYSYTYSYSYSYTDMYTYTYTYSYSYTYTYTYAYIARRRGPGSWALARCVSF